MKLFDRVAGVIFGTAIGDAMGAPVEFQYVNPDKPVVHDLKCYRGVARYTDDTQMMAATFLGLLQANTWVSVDDSAEAIAQEYMRWSVSPENTRAPGGACMLGCRNLARGVAWRESGKVDGGGCGAAMRSMAYGVWHRLPSPLATMWAAQHALMTHRHPMAMASAAAVAAGVQAGLDDGSPETVAVAMAVAAAQYDRETKMMLREASLGEGPAAVVLDRWRGWAGHEAVAASLWCFMRHPDSYREAVLLASNSPGDSDSLGAITGALVGARVGLKGIPEAWVSKIENYDNLEWLARDVTEAIEAAPPVAVVPGVQL